MGGHPKKYYIFKQLMLLVFFLQLASLQKSKLCSFLSGYTAKIAGTERGLKSLLLHLVPVLEKLFYLYTQQFMQICLEKRLVNIVYTAHI